jgi:hypothetical protein
VPYLPCFARTITDETNEHDLPRARSRRIGCAVNGPIELSVQPDRASHYTPPMTPSSSGWLRINSEAPQRQLSQESQPTRERTRFRGGNDCGERKRPAPLEFVERNAGSCCLRGTPKPCSRVEQALERLFACRGGVHVNLHANLHFDDLRRFPSH